MRENLGMMMILYQTADPGPAHCPRFHRCESSQIFVQGGLSSTPIGSAGFQMSVEALDPKELNTDMGNVMVCSSTPIGRAGFQEARSPKEQNTDMKKCDDGLFLLRPSARR
jgi:hypothetical protein